MVDERGSACVDVEAGLAHMVVCHRAHSHSAACRGGHRPVFIDAVFDGRIRLIRTVAVSSILVVVLKRATITVAWWLLSLSLSRSSADFGTVLNVTLRIAHKLIWT